MERQKEISFFYQYLPEIWAAWAEQFFCWSITRTIFFSQPTSSTVQFNALSSPPERMKRLLLPVHLQSKLLIPDWWIIRLPNGSIWLSSSISLTFHTASRPLVPAESNNASPASLATIFTCRTQQLWKLHSCNISNRRVFRDKSKHLAENRC